MANLSKIKLLMAKKNISQKEMAGKLNITRQQLNHIIKTNSTSIERLEMIAKELGFENGNEFVFIQFEKCIAGLTENFTMLKDLQKTRWNYIEAHQLETVIARLGAMLKELQNYGFDIWRHTPVNEMGIKKYSF